MDRLLLPRTGLRKMTAVQVSPGGGKRALRLIVGMIGQRCQAAIVAHEPQPVGNRCRTHCDADIAGILPEGPGIRALGITISPWPG